MTTLAALAPKLAVFIVAAVIGGGVSLVGLSALNPPALPTPIAEAPQFILASAEGEDEGAGGPAGFDVLESPSEPTLLEGLPPADMALAAESLLDAGPVIGNLNPLGYPRIPHVSQFDGGPLASSNCNMAAGAMLARLGFGIVTTGSILRSLQDDQEGGTDLNDLQTALWRGYGVTVKTGAITSDQLKALLAAGYGAVVHGDYSKIPIPLRLQPTFENPHAVYIDGYFAGNEFTPPAYYIMDPIGRPGSGYRGEWWPASIVDDFALEWGPPGRLVAAWVFPPGGIPPDVVGPDVLPIPPDGSTPAPTPTPGETLEPGETPEPTPTPLPPMPEPGVDPPAEPPFDPPIVDQPKVGDVVLIPGLLICLLAEPPPGCPTGLEGVFDVPGELIPVDLGPDVQVVFVDSDRPNVVLVGFRVQPFAPAQVRFWPADGVPAQVLQASAMSALDILGQTTIVARLDVLAATTYHFQVVAGDGLFAGYSQVGTFTTGSGLTSFDVALSSVASPSFGLETGFSPYIRLATNALAQPLEPCFAIGDGGICQVLPGSLEPATAVTCSSVARFGGTEFCLGRIGTPSPPPPVCQRASVTYELTGIEATGVMIRAYPSETGVLPGGDVALSGILEAVGPAGSGQVSIGCLASGMDYTIAVDALGDDRGILASRQISVP